MMKTIAIIASSTVIPLIILPSCGMGKDDIGKGTGIRIGEITEIAPDTKAPALTMSDTMSFTSDVAEITIGIKEERISTPTTKASPRDADFLKENGFSIDGFLGEGATEYEKHFMAGADVQYFNEDDLWYIMANYGDRAAYKWRNGTEHLFWAYTKDISPDIVIGNDGKVSAAFDYLSQGEEDILMAYEAETWNEGDPTDLSLTFRHALSAFVFESGNFTTYYKVPGHSELQASQNGLTPIVSITAIEVVGLRASGSCMFDGSGFTWQTDGPLSSIDAAAIEGGNRDYHLFAIPQMWTNWGFRVTFKDETSGVELLPMYFTKNEAREIVAGIRYRTNISGKVVFPIPDVEIGGGKIELEGHKVDSYPFEGFSYEGINKIRISWDGEPDATSSGLRACIYLGDTDPQALGRNEGDLKGFLANMEKENFVYGFYIDGKGRHLVKGETSDDGRSYSIVIDLTSDWFKESANGELSIHFAYTGANSSGGTGWTAENIRLEVVEYSTPY